jgi:hypothetical protein
MVKFGTRRTQHRFTLGGMRIPRYLLASSGSLQDICGCWGKPRLLNALQVQTGMT